MLILVNGLPYFSKKIVDDLNEFDKVNRYVFFDTYSSDWQKIRFLLTLPFCSAVISFNGISDKSNLFDWVILFKKKVIMQWHGADVDLAVQRTKNKTIDRKYIDYSTHLVSAPWFSEELKNVIDKTIYAPFSYVDSAGNSNLYDKIKLLTYLANDKEEFYGWNEIYSFAKQNPEIEITVIGSDGKGLNAPPSVNFKGWISKDELLVDFKRHAIFIRLTDHDGKALTVSQALGAGCEVIWTYQLDNCHYIEKDSVQLDQKIKELTNLIANRNLSPNQKNINYAKEHLLRESVIANYVEKLKIVLDA